MILWFVALPIVMALIVALLHRLSLTAALLSSATFLAMAVRLLTLEPIYAFNILGRHLELSEGARLGLSFCFALLTLMMLYAYRVRQRDLSYAVTLAATGFFVAALMMDSATLAVLWLEMGAVLAVMLIPAGDEKSAMLGMRTLLLLALSGLFLLLAAWTMEPYMPELPQALRLRLGAGALVIGFGIALGIVPFSIWLPPILRSGRLLAAVMLNVVLGGVLLIFLGSMLADPVWAGAQPLIHTLLLGGGIMTCLLGGLGALPQGSISGALAYAALADLGLVFVGLGIGSQESVSAAVLHFAYRALGVVVVGMAAGLFRFRLGGDDHEHLAGAWQRAPLAVIGLIVGGLSLAGLPPMAGFGTRLTLYRALAAEHAPWAGAIVLSSLGAIWAFGRCIVASFMPAIIPQREYPPRWSGLLELPLSLPLLALGLCPQLLSLLPLEWLHLLSSVPGFVL